MHTNPNKRQEIDLCKKGEKIGELLGLEKVPLYNMAWKESRLRLPGNGECYPLIDVLEKIAEDIKQIKTALHGVLGTLSVEVKPQKRGRKPKKESN